MTEEEMEEMDRREKEEARQAYHEREAEKNQRIADNSLDPDNKKTYAHRAKEHRKKAVQIAEKPVANPDESGIIKGEGNQLQVINSSDKIETTGYSDIDYSSVGSRGFTEEVRQQMLRDERIISGNNYETAILYRADGTRVLTKKGSKDSVSFTKKEIAEVKGGVLSHNHPNGTVFSPEDIDAMRNGQLAEIRACNSRGAYVLRINSKWHPDIPNLGEISARYWECMNESGQLFAALAAQEGKSPMYYLRQMDEYGLELFAKRYGLEFSWEDKI